MAVTSGQFSGDAIFSYLTVRISKVITNESSQIISEPVISALRSSYADRTVLKTPCSMVSWCVGALLVALNRTECKIYTAKL